MANYNDLGSGYQKILQDGLNFRKGPSYDKELKRLEKMYPGFIPDKAEVPKIPKDINTPGAWDTYEGWYGATREQLNPGMQSQGLKGMSSLADLTAQGHDWSGEKAAWQGRRDAWLKNNPINPQDTTIANDPFSKDINYDTFNWMLKTYPGSGAAQWYLRNPTAPSSKNPFLKPGSFVPGQDLVKRDDKSKTEIARIESGDIPRLTSNTRSTDRNTLTIGGNSKGGSGNLGTGIVV